MRVGLLHTDSLEPSWLMPLLRELEILGCETKVVSFPTDPSFAKSFSELVAFNADFFLMHNAYVLDPRYPVAGLLDDYFCQSDSPKVYAWFIDHPRCSGSARLQFRWAQPPFPRRMHALCVDRHHQTFFEERGIQSSFFPLAVDHHLLEAPTPLDMLEKYRCRLSFAARPPSLGLESPIYDLPTLRKAFFSACHNESLHLLRSLCPVDKKPFIEAELLKVRSSFYHFFAKFVSSSEEFEAHRKVYIEQLQQSFPSWLFDYFNIIQHRGDFTYSFFQMVAYIQRLFPLGLKVYGGESWKEFLPVTSPSPVLSMPELIALFRASEINFCFTKWVFPSSVPERQLLAAAAGGFILSDAREDLDLIFGPNICPRYSSFEEAETQIQYFWSHPDERKERARLMQKRVLENHTFQKRAKQLFELHQTSKEKSNSSPSSEKVSEGDVKPLI